MKEPPTSEDDAAKAKAAGIVGGVGGGDDTDPKDDTIAELETRVESLDNKLHEERFIWILVIILLADAFVFSVVQNWAGALVIGVIELIAIVILADRCKVDTVAPLIDRLTGFVQKTTGRD